MLYDADYLEGLKKPKQKTDDIMEKLDIEQRGQIKEIVEREEMQPAAEG